MNKLLNMMAFLLAAMISLVGASALTVDSLALSEDDGDYIAVVALANPTSTTEFGRLTVSIDELNIADDTEIIEVASNTTRQLFSFNLKDVISDYNSLEQGETYTLRVSTGVLGSEDELVSFLFGSERSSDAPVEIRKIEINDIAVAASDVLDVNNGDTIEVQLQVYAFETIDKARFEILVSGYEHRSLYAVSDEPIKMVAGTTKYVTLSLDLPTDMDNEEEYTLEIRGRDEVSSISEEYSLYVNTQRDRVDVLDFITTPSSGVEPGQTVIAEVRMKNRGQKDQESVRVNVAIPELGISESSYVSSLGRDEVVTSDDMLIFVPEEAAAGQYQVIVTLEYDEGYDESFSTFVMNVLSPRLVDKENLLVSFNNNVDLVAGTAKSFDVVVANPNSVATPISLAALDAAWADVEVSPSLAMVQSGSDATFTVTVTPKSAIAGEKELVLSVKEGTNTAADLTVNTYVEGSDELDMTNVILAVLLVIAIIVLLALVVTIARRKGDNNSEDTEEYY
jgi:hypothetical protein